MDDGALKTLFLPFETDEVSVGEGNWLFLGAQVPPFDCPIPNASLHAVQGFRSTYNALIAAKANVFHSIPEGEFHGALILLTRHRGQNRAFLNRALERVKPGGTIVVSGAKTDGILSTAKEVSSLFEIQGTLSKNHAKVFWFESTGNAQFDEQQTDLIDGRYQASAGMFSSDHIDPGSAFLIEHLPKDLKGKLADFCAGWGYLSAEAALKCANIKSIALFEADHASLEAAKINMQHIAPDMPATFLWHDLAGEKQAQTFDTVIMNPPFHQGRAAEPSLGNAIIKTAANALHRTGRLYLVANRSLMYEPMLKAHFFKSGEVARNASYKVLWAEK